MKEKNIKFIMELIFIFILPLLFILFNVSINNNYVYDNEGNFETSSKELEYESIVYNEYYKNYLDFNQLFTLNDIYTDSGVSYIGNDFQFSLTLNDAYYGIGLFLNPSHKYYLSSYSNTQSVLIGYYNNSVVSEWFTGENGIFNYFFTNADFLVFTGANVGTYNFTGTMVIDLTQMFGSGYEPNNIADLNNYISLSEYYTYTASSIIEYNSDDIVSSNYNLVKSPFIYIKDLISGFFNIDKNNITFNIVIDYTCVWFLMFVLWHLVYCLFDFIIHLIRIKKKE